MITIEIGGAAFFAWHGFYPEEQLLGNRFVVDIAVDFAKEDLFNDKISNTVDYEQLYEIAASEMLQTKKLLETVAESIINRIKHQFPYIEAARVGIKKLNPPMKGKIDYAGITITYQKKDHELQ